MMKKTKEAVPVLDRRTPEYWADWLVDVVAGSTQDRRFLRGDPAEDKVATAAIYLNGKQALENMLAAISQDERADG